MNNSIDLHMLPFTLAHKNTTLNTEHSASDSKGFIHTKNDILEGKHVSLQTLLCHPNPFSMPKTDAKLMY